MVSDASHHPLKFWADPVDRSGAEHMALDESLLKLATGCLWLRFYQWKTREITVGVFVRSASIGDSTCPVTRRWTGGGVVEHGEDLTFSLAIPSVRLGMEGAAAGRYYRWIHEGLAAALRESGFAGAMAEPAVPLTAGTAADYCFSNPVAWDVMDRDRGVKIAGGAQRRSREGLLHQGSVRLPAPWNRIDHPWIARFAGKLAAPGAIVEKSEPGAAAFSLAEKLRSERYAHPDWLARR